MGKFPRHHPDGDEVHLEDAPSVAQKDEARANAVAAGPHLLQESRSRGVCPRVNFVRTPLFFSDNAVLLGSLRCVLIRRR